MVRTPTVSVVMPTFNRAYALPRVVRPILDDPAAAEVIVVVDGSPDDSLAILERMADGEPRLRPLAIENSGEMGARQRGAEAATADVVLFLDDDVLAEPGLVSGHARRHAEGAADVVLGYMPVALSSERTGGAVATWIYAREYEGRCQAYERDPGTVLTALWAGNFSMRRDACLAVGMPNPAFTERYHPDRDFGIRCFEAGLSGTFDRALRARHLHARSLPAFVRDAHSQGAARVLLARLHPQVVGRLPDDEFERGLPALLRRLVRLSRRRYAYRLVAALLRGLSGAAGAAGIWTAQDYAVRLLRRMAQQRGAIEQARRMAQQRGAIEQARRMRAV